MTLAKYVPSAKQSHKWGASGGPMLLGPHGEEDLFDALKDRMMCNLISPVKDS